MSTMWKLLKRRKLVVSVAIFLSPALRFESYRVEPSLLSDHRAVVAELGWQ